MDETTDLADDAGDGAGGPARERPHRRESFSEAKRLLVRKVYADHRETLYCGCRFDARLQLDLASCGYVPKKDDARAHRVEWEHVVPAEAFGQSFAEWRDGHPDCVDRQGRAFRGRQCARKRSALFREMEADLYNLVPEIGELNALRSNFTVAEIPGEPRELGSCDVEVVDRKFEPRPAVRGEIARTYLYMDATYPGRGIVSDKSRKLLAAWAATDPVDAWECTRARRIEALQGNAAEPTKSECSASGR